MSKETKIIGDNERKSKFDPDLAKRVNKEVDEREKAEEAARKASAAEKALQSDDKSSDTSDKEIIATILPTNYALDRIVFAAHHEMFCIKRDRVFKILTLHKDSTIWAIAAHDSKLYYTGFGDGCQVHEYLSNTITAQRNGIVNCLAVCDGVLYDGGVNGSIYETLSNKLVSIKTPSVTALGSFIKMLYAGNPNEVYNVFSNHLYPPKKRPSTVHAIAATGDVLYDAGEYHMIYGGSADKIFATRHGTTNALVPLNNGLYDAGSYKSICDSFHDPEGTRPLLQINKEITAMCAVSPEMLDELMENAEEIKYDLKML